MNILDTVKAIAGLEDTSKDYVIPLLENKARQYIKVYCNRDDTDTMDFIIVQMILEDLNKCGFEGVASHSFSGVSENFGSDYTDAVKNALNAYRKMKVV